MALENHLKESSAFENSSHNSEFSKEISFPVRITRRIIVFMLFMMAVNYCFGQSSKQTTIIGKVIGPQDEPIQYANVYLKGTSTGTVTNSKGMFKFQTNLKGSYTLIISLIGFVDYEKQLNLPSVNKYSLEIQLKEKLLDLGNANVTSSSFTTGDIEGVTLSPTEIVTTPGAAADIFRAMKSFPGVASVNEGSGLFVRGGDVTETKILLDQATVVHPYKYETPTGGVFGTIPPFLVSGTFFSTGGFPARYGNALSGVLSMKSQGLPNRNTTSFNLGLAAASAGLSAQLIPEKLGVNFSGNKSFTETMFRVNGQADEFSEAPSSTDLNLNLIYKPKPNSTIKAFSYVTDNQVGVPVDEPSFRGNYHGEESNQLYNLQWTQLFEDREWLMENSFSMNRFSKSSNLGVLDFTERDITYKFRSDWERQFSDVIKFYGGTEAIHKENDFEGIIPREDGILDSDAASYQLDESYNTSRFGAYSEVDLKPGYRWVFNMGIRSDYHELSDEFTVDPRASFRYQFSKKTNLRAAAGIYHQFPQPFQFNQESGSPQLKAQESIHYILGFEHEAELLHFRVEGYFKDYNQLVISDNQQNLSNRGYGDAKGIDVFLRYSRFLQTRFNGWISYSFLQSNRYQSRTTENGHEFEKAPSDFDITHNLNVVGKVRIFNIVYAGVSYNYATGRPYTPIVNSYQGSTPNYYLPIEGSINSRRLPDFQRLDLNLSYYWALPNNQSITFYFSVSNALNRQNVSDYTYNQDYSQKTPVYSNYNRFYYAGVSANLNL
jgi:hypothetical protein